MLEKHEGRDVNASPVCSRALRINKSPSRRHRGAHSPQTPAGGLNNLVLPKVLKYVCEEYVSAGHNGHTEAFSSRFRRCLPQVASELGIVLFYCKVDFFLARVPPLSI